MLEGNPNPASAGLSGGLAGASRSDNVSNLHGRPFSPMTNRGTGVMVRSSRDPFVRRVRRGERFVRQALELGGVWVPSIHPPPGCPEGS